MTQNEEILTALRAGETLTPLDALKRFGCMRLAARINDLRAQGHLIETIPVKGQKSYAAYRLVHPHQTLLFPELAS